MAQPSRVAANMSEPTMLWPDTHISYYMIYFALLTLVAGVGC